MSHEDARKGTLSSFNLLCLWFGAAVSVAEILAGGYLADLGLSVGLWAILIGHLVGTALLALAGVIGFRERLPSIMSCRISFGKQGSYLISVVNVLQLVGWTAIMVMEGGSALSGVTETLWGFSSQPLMAALLGAFVALWVGVGVHGFKYLNMVAVLLLFGLTVLLSVVVLGEPGAAEAGSGGGSFALGLELSVIMPLSWFPLIADYTSQARSRTGSWLAPFVAYFIGSSWMYAIGLMGALHTGNPDPAVMMVAAGLGLAALCVVGLSTITTTFLDVYSAAVSAQNVLPRLPRRWTAVVVAALGTVLGMYFPMDRYVDFLLVLGSVFAPLAVILLSDYFLFHRDARERAADPVAWVSLVLGIGVYYGLRLLELDHLLVMGHTLAAMLVTLLLHGLLRLLEQVLGSRKAASAQT